MIGGNFSYGKDDIPWYPGTVKRTKQKIEEKQSAPITRSSSGSSSNNQQPMTIDAKNNNNNNNFNDSNNKILCDIKKSLLIDNLSNRTSQGPSLSTSPQQPHKFAKLQQSSSVSSAAISSSKAHTRCKSEEYLTAQRAILSAVHRNNDRNNNRNSQPLSVSAPETFCLNFIKNNRNIENEISTTSLKLQQRRHNLKKSATESCTSEQHVGDKKNKKENQQIGKVKNLKMNFEAKANNSSSSNNNNNNINVNSVTYRENKKNSHSLPSSPIAIHIDVNSASTCGSGFPSSNLSDISAEDINVRGLVDRYEIGKIKTFATPNIRQRPKSLYDPRFQLKTSQDKKAALMISHQTKGDDLKQRPPIPIQPIVKNALMTSNLNNVCSTKQSVGNCRRMQQGKTHPLSKLGINKQRINTSQATAYNTM